MVLTQRQALGPRPAAPAQATQRILEPCLPDSPQPGCPRILSLGLGKLLLQAPGCHQTFLRLRQPCLLLDLLHRCSMGGSGAPACLHAEGLGSSHTGRPATGCALPQTGAAWTLVLRGFNPCCCAVHDGCTPHMPSMQQGWWYVAYVLPVQWICYDPCYGYAKS